ncbi:hypothetical protein GMO_08110 [Gluconobacter morbifer G707]|uniref:Uncharacterized protein n=1 Tax=Gluconobacter morbifer G707 TaxID=1088869 RepID=G6XH46_9PROT|nr:hypothetical protein GMO_08110 [Gluconobacter morbifer G707]
MTEVLEKIVSFSWAYEKIFTYGQGTYQEYFPVLLFWTGKYGQN